jgi:nicotinate-nucleotide pyrophosphorylase (carboxylating)
MSFWGPPEAAAFAALLPMALAEDLGERGDLTGQAVLPLDLPARANLVARKPGVVAGLAAFAGVYAAIDPGVVVTPRLGDGAVVDPGQVVATLTGPARSVFTGERTALNFVQRLSGVATLTRRYVDAVAGLSCQILDTRKTTPGWRRLEKFAVRCGGGRNHRLGLYDGVMLKDNHRAVLAAAGRSLSQAVHAARELAGPGVIIEVEVDNPDQLAATFAAQPDVVLLDNMIPDQLGECVRLRNALAPHIRLEASGGVDLTTVRAIAATGVDFISVGALTHSAPALDLALDEEVAC